MPMFVLLVLFIGIPALEIAVVIQVAHALGLVTTLGLMLADAVVGSMLMRSQGRAAWRRFTAAMAAGRVPGREVLDGGLIIFGGALLMAPGFVTDVLGALCLAPPSRAVIRRMLARRVTGGLVIGTFSGALAGRLGHRRGTRYDADATAVELRPPSLDR